eukprot:2183102-Rhodomonas_salina.1
MRHSRLHQHHTLCEYETVAPYTVKNRTATLCSYAMLVRYASTLCYVLRMLLRYDITRLAYGISECALVVAGSALRYARTDLCSMALRQVRLIFIWKPTHSPAGITLSYTPPTLSYTILYPYAPTILPYPIPDHILLPHDPTLSYPMLLPYDPTLCCYLMTLH